MRGNSKISGAFIRMHSDSPVNLARLDSKITGQCFNKRQFLKDGGRTNGKVALPDLSPKVASNFDSPWILFGPFLS
jgi:hypothetical protein